MSNLHIGVDLGGMKIAAGIVSDHGELITKSSMKTPRGAENIADAIYNCAMLAMDLASIDIDDVSTVGVGVPGTVFPRGNISFACNIGLKSTPLADMLESRFERPVFLENDGNCAAAGEYLAGSGVGSRSLLAVTLGTGIGGGYVENGRLFRGFNGCGAELGHMVIVHGGRECSCVRRGCFEAYASVSALISMLRDYIENYPLCPCAVLSRERGVVDGHTVFLAMDAGDSGAKELYQRYISYLACGVTNLVNIFQPEIVCLGGGISARGERLLAPVREILMREDYARDCAERTKLVAALLGNDAGIIGSALLHKINTFGD
ncbi:MAG: ROK family protein [Oscillospiraceae bacterium]